MDAEVFNKHVDDALRGMLQFVWLSRSLGRPITWANASQRDMKNLSQRARMECDLSGTKCLSWQVLASALPSNESWLNLPTSLYASQKRSRWCKIESLTKTQSKRSTWRKRVATISRCLSRRLQNSGVAAPSWCEKLLLRFEAVRSALVCDSEEINR